MNKSSAVLKKILFSLLLIALFLSSAGPGLADPGPIGKVAVYTGEIIFRSQGVWGGEVVTGLPIYSGDKLVTLDGSAELVFEDGSSVTLCRYSSIEFKQWTHRGLPLIQSDMTRRRFTLYMGKMWIETDYRRMRSEIAVPPMVSGLREDAGTTRIAALISLDEDGEAYMSFDEGDRSFTIGPWKIGVAENVPPQTAKNNEFIKKALAAKTAAIVAQRASEKDDWDAAAADSTRKLAWIRANKASAEEAFYCAGYLEKWTPDKQILADAREAMRQTKERLDSAAEAEKAVLEAGALEEEWNALYQAAMDVFENQRAIEGGGRPEASASWKAADAAHPKMRRTLACPSPAPSPEKIPANKARKRCKSPGRFARPGLILRPQPLLDLFEVVLGEFGKNCERPPTCRTARPNNGRNSPSLFPRRRPAPRRLRNIPACGLPWAGTRRS